MREKILTVIEKNSRIDLKELAIILGVDEAAILNELAAMEKEHVICGYHTLINWEKTGVEKVMAMIEVRVTPQRGMGFDKVAERIYNYPEVESVYLISGSFDFMVVLDGKNLREVSQFVSEKLSTLDLVLSTKTNFILKFVFFFFNSNLIPAKTGIKFLVEIAFETLFNASNKISFFIVNFIYIPSFFSFFILLLWKKCITQLLLITTIFFIMISCG